MLKRNLAANVLHASGLGRLIRNAVPWNGLLVLNYHRVGNNSASRFNQDLWSATAEDFDAQVRFFKENADIVGQDDIDAVFSKRSGRFVQFTFDDGYRDNYEIAFPILKSYGARATFFVVTGFLDEPRVPWWDEIAWMVRGSASPLGGNAARDKVVGAVSSVYRTISPGKASAFLDLLGESMGTGRCTPADAKDLWMTWDMAREMQKGGMYFGGHTLTHCELARLPRAEQFREIKTCKDRIEAELGTPMKTFSYPYGEEHVFNTDTWSCLQELGVKFAYSYYGGYQNAQTWEPLNILRFPMERHVTPSLWNFLGTAPRAWRILD